MKIGSECEKSDVILASCCFTYGTNVIRHADGDV